MKIIFSSTFFESLKHRMRAYRVGLLMFFTLLFLLAVIIYLLSIWREERNIAAELRRAQTESRISHVKAVTSAPASKFNFIDQLPSALDPQSVLSEIRRSCVAEDTALGGVQIQPRAIVGDQLTRTDLTLKVRGAYPKLKRILAGVLGRFQSTTLVHLALHRATTSQDAEATMVIALWARPSTSTRAAALVTESSSR
jgi:hypothetical protein